MEWLIVLGLLGLAAGLAAGYLLANRASGGAGRVRELEAELARSRREQDDYRREVVKQFSETARKFQNLNDSYTDLHQQLAKSSSVLCGDVSGPLLVAPSGHQDLIPAEVRHGAASSDGSAGDAAAGNDKEPPTLHHKVAQSRREPATAQRPSEPASPGSADGAPATSRRQPTDAKTAAHGKPESDGAGGTKTAADDPGRDIRVPEPAPGAGARATAAKPDPTGPTRPEAETETGNESPARARESGPQSAADRKPGDAGKAPERRAAGED